MTDVLAEVRARLREHFDRSGESAEPSVASVTFLGAESMILIDMDRPVRETLRAVGRALQAAEARAADAR